MKDGTPHENSRAKLYVSSLASLLTILTTAVWTDLARADDPCAQPTKEAKKVLTDLNASLSGEAVRGRFQVRKTQTSTSAQFEVMYLVTNKPIYSATIVQHPAVSEHLYAGVSKKRQSTLELGYAFGAGGAISCEFEIALQPSGKFGLRTIKAPR